MVVKRLHRQTGTDEKARLRRDTGWSNECARPVSVWGDCNLHGAGNPREDDRDRRNDRVMSMAPARQLHLFKGKRQCGIRSNGATEFQLHCAVVDNVRRGIYTHIASGDATR